MWNCIGHLEPLHSFAVVSPSLRGKEVSNVQVLELVKVTM